MGGLRLQSLDTSEIVLSADLVVEGAGGSLAERVEMVLQLGPDKTFTCSFCLVRIDPRLYLQT